MLLIRILLVAAWFLVAGAGEVMADPISIGLAFTAFASSAIGGIVINAVIGLALSFAIGLIQRMLTPQTERKIGFELNLAMGDTEPIGFTAGYSATAGTRKYVGTWGQLDKTPNAYLVDVIQLGDIPAPGLNGMWVNDERSDLIFGEPHSEFGIPIRQFREGNTDHMWVKFRTGLENTPDSYMTSRFGGAERAWLPDMVGVGCPHVIVTMLIDEDLFSGVPTYVFEPAPTVWYDLRKDSTNGGSGSHRWGDPTTWEATTNPVILIYNIIRGVYFGAEWVYGGQNIAAFRLPQSSWMAAANECDVQILLADGTHEAQFRFGAEIKGDSEPLTVIEALRNSCNARIAEIGGRFEILVGAPGAAIYSFSDNDIVVTKGQSYKPHPTLSETHNAIEASYPDPTTKWVLKDAVSRYSDDLERDDGNRRLPVNITFNLVPYAYQVQRLMKAMILEERRFRVHQFFLMPEAWVITPNSVVSWTSVRNGYSNKKFLVTAIEGEPGMLQQVTLREIDPSDYSWSTSDQIPVSVGSEVTIRPAPQAMIDFYAVGSAIPGTGGLPKRAAILLGWDGEQPDVDAVQFEVRLSDTLEVIHQGRTDTPASGAILISQSIFAKTHYQVRGKYIPGSNRRTLWSDWLNVLTPDIRLSLEDVDAEFNNVIGILTGLEEGSLSASLQDLYARLDQLAAAATGDTVKAVTERRELQVSLDKTDGRVFEVNAYFLEQVTVLVSADQALATKITVLTASFNQNVAFVGQQLIALATKDSALASLINEVAVEVDGVTANALFNMTASAGPGGTWSTKISAVVRATAGGSFFEAGYYILLNSSGQSSFAVKANQFYLLDSSGGVVASPFYVSGGVTYIDQVVINGANIQSLTVGTEKITGNAVSSIVVSSAGPAVVQREQAGQYMQSLAMIVTYGVVQVIVTAYQNRPGSGSGNFGNYVIHLLRDGAEIRAFPQFYDDNFSQPIVFTHADTPGPGYHNYQVYFSLSGGDGNFTISGTVISLTNFKR